MLNGSNISLKLIQAVRQEEVTPEQVETAEVVKAEEIRFPVHDDDYFENMPPREWAIPGMIPGKSVVIVYGPPGGGKSLLTMQWAMHIAQGHAWCGRSIKKQRVVYVAAEGSFGIALRTKAQKIQWKLSGFEVANSGVKWVDRAVLLNNTGDVATFISNLEAQLADEKPDIIFIDTVSRCTPGADENSNKDMSLAIGSVDVIRETFDCTVVLVHHDGKDGSKGPRGAQALKGNVEVAIHVTPVSEGRNKLVKVHSEKMKDAADFNDFHMSIKTYQLDERDSNCTGAVLIPAGAIIAEQEEERDPLTPRQRQCLNILGSDKITYGQWRDRCIQEGILENTFKDAFKSLKLGGHIAQWGQNWGVYTPKKDSTQQQLDI